MTTVYLGKSRDPGARSRRVVDLQNAGKTDDDYLLCCWDDCDRHGVDSHKCRIFIGIDPRHGGPIYTWPIFCSERHRQFYLNAPRNLYNLPAGYRLATL